MAWLQITFTVNADKAEHCASVLSDAGAFAVTFQDMQNEPIFEIHKQEPPLWQKTGIIGLFDSEQDLAQVENTIQTELKLGTDLVWEPLADKDWQMAWQAHFKPVAIGKRLWICPTWHPLPLDALIPVWIDPGMAFGTGTHPTTQMCLTWLEAHLIPGSRVIDYGCGSGILGIAALKLGATHVWGVDCESQALITTAENFKKNDCTEHQFTLSLPEHIAIEPHSADVIVANILAEPLLALKDTFQTLLKPGGTLILSGILDSQADMILLLYSTGFENFTLNQVDEWICIQATALNP